MFTRDKESRKDYINLARNARVPIRCFVMKTSHDHARLVNKTIISDPTFKEANNDSQQQYLSTLRHIEEAHRYLRQLTSKKMAKNFLLIKIKNLI